MNRGLVGIVMVGVFILGCGDDETEQQQQDSDLRGKASDVRSRSDAGPNNQLPLDGGSICTLPADAGPCEAAMPQWFHNAETGRCEQFTYGGCEGNANRFDTLEACNQDCPPVA
jgi:hypothetical protein